MLIFPQKVFDDCTTTMDLSFEKQVESPKAHQELAHSASEAIGDILESFKTFDAGTCAQAKLPFAPPMLTCIQILRYSFGDNAAGI